MSDAPLFLDINVPMYAAGKQHVYKEPCAWVLSEVANGALPAAIDTEIVQEVLYRYGALQEWKFAAEMAEGLLDLLPVVLPVTGADMRRAVQLFAEHAPRGVRARDVLHAAVMYNNGLTHIISTDKHFDELPHITRLDPHDLYNARAQDGARNET